MNPVYVLGGAQSDFARNLAREGASIVGLTGEVIDGALAAASLDLKAIEAIHVGNAFGELFSGQGQMGALPATARSGLSGVPAARHEAACASGSVAILAAMADIGAGKADCVLVMGIEQERNVAGDVAARYMGTAALAGESSEARYLWPHQFSQVADEVDRRWGLEPRALRAIAERNLAAARKNPRAQARGWTFSPDAFLGGWTDDQKNPVIEGRLRRLDCSQVTDGAAALVLASPSFAMEHAKRTGRSLDGTARIEGYGHRTAALSLRDKLDALSPDEKLARKDEHLFPHLRRAIADAYFRAGVGADGKGVAGAEVHDCFTITEYVILDHIPGLCDPGKAWRLIEDGSIDGKGRFAVNPSGGLIGAGHPVGASGVRMALDAARQVEGKAGDYQVEGAKKFLTVNIGGSVTTACAFVLATGG